MKNLLVLVLLVSFSVGIHAQSGRNVEENQFKINFINPSVEYEVGVGTDQAINLGLGLQFGASGGSLTTLFYHQSMGNIDSITI